MHMKTNVSIIPDRDDINVIYLSEFISVLVYQPFYFVGNL